MKHRVKMYTAGSLVVLHMVLASGASAAVMDSRLPIVQADMDQPVEFSLDAINSIERYVASEVGLKTFAGLYLEQSDPQARNKIILSFTQEIDAEHQQAIRDLAGEEFDVEFRMVKHSLIELREKQNEIEGYRAELEKKGVNMVTLGVDTVDNRVEVGILPYSPELASEIVQRVGSDMVFVEESPEFTTMAAPEVTSGPSASVATTMEASGSLASDAADASTQTRIGLLGRIFQALSNWLRAFFS